MGSERRRGFVMSAAACLGVLTMMAALQYDYSEQWQHHYEGAAVHSTAGLPRASPQPAARAVSQREEVLPTRDQKAATQPAAAAVPARLSKVLGNVHASQLLRGDELLDATNQTLDFLDKYETLGTPQMLKTDLQTALRDRGFAKIDGLLSRPVAADLRQYLLSLLNAEGATWKPNEGDDPRGGSLGRACYGLAPKFYAPLEKIMKESRITDYMASLMPGICPGVDEQQFRMTQLFITVNDRIKWHVDYPNQPPHTRDGRTTMYSPAFCQFKTIFYLQDHGSEGAGNPSALMVVPDTHTSEPLMTRCGPHNCSIARKGIVPSDTYTSVNLQPNLGDLLVMDARLLHAAADYSLTLPKAPKPEPRLHKYRVFLQFLWGIHNNKLTDAMQKKKDKNLVTAPFKQKLFPDKATSR